MVVDEPAVLAPPTVVASNVHVDYKVYAQSSLSVKRRLADKRFGRESRTVHAVRGVDIVVREGESVGLIGSNGSGKSTLLRALSGLVPVREGEILVRSRPTLLGVGAALRPQLSGRLNIMIGGLALGMTRREIQEQMDPMIEFSGLRESIDLPMRTYSSGMRARLAFTIATARTPDILLIDEALAVGDAEFRSKSAQRIEEIRRQAGAVIIVSHSLTDITSSCSRAYWLDRGVVQAEGPAKQVVSQYRKSVNA